MPIRIHAPLAGWSAPLAEIPDAVFARGMLGEGAAIDPLGRELRAPCDGEVISIAASRHAVALRSAAGAEILVHVGIDTVGLGGEGFELHVRKGDRVRTRDLLVSFDLDGVSRRAPSLMTPVILTNGDRFRITRMNLNTRVDHGDWLFELEPTDAAAAVPAQPGTGRQPVVTDSVVVQHAHGIHARPAAMIARAAKSLPVDIEIRARGRGADARSAVALMSLGIRGGDEVVVTGFVPSAAAGVAAIVKVIRELEDAPTHAAARVAAPVPAEPGKLRGVTASRGYAAGQAFYLPRAQIPVTEPGQGVAPESAALDRAREAVRARLTQLSASAATTVREIMAAHLELLDDPLLLTEARVHLSSGKSAAFAWRASLRASAATLEATGDARLAERVDDLRDLEQQVLLALGGAPASKAHLPEGAILLARDLTPSQFIELDAARLAGIALVAGGPTSHVALLAAAAGVPMLVALGPSLLEAEAGASLILDAESAVLHTTPDSSEFARAQATVAERQAENDLERALAQRDCRLASGERIEVFANLSGTVSDAELAVAQGAEGCGLLRTEFLFLDRATPPDEHEQLRCYQAVARILGERPLIIRTMDIGGDKPIPYLPLPPEDNPALGLRGIRTSLWRPDLLDAQLRALLRVQPAGQCRILLPMITERAEIRAVRERLRSLAGEAPLPKIGAMIETPAAALLADQIAAEVDFLSIGTNDLTQYTLAMDRGHAELAPRIDGLHPAVISLIARVGAAGERHGKLVAVCGGLASDPVAAPLLLGLGVRELSVVPTLIPQLKAKVSSLTLADCRALAERALMLDSAAAVRALAREVGP